MKFQKLIPALSLLIPAIAQAQPSESTGVDHAVAPADGALEISIATGYAQGVGKTGGGLADLDELSGPGGAVQLEIGYRLIPHLTLGAYGSLAMHDNGDAVDDSVDVFGASAGVQAAWHFRPDRSIDPWVKLGTGWKGLWLDPNDGKTTSLQGLELARLQVGVDYRISPEVAIAPVVGGSLGMFVSQDSPMTTEYTELDGKEVNFTAFAGLAGTFDLASR
ncbi:MAG TPA: hypothetical protein VFQ53_31975 [Kofleriaceae bacterium]|nr:hypothetical protein [Kofleriaceae bacterium]